MDSSSKSVPRARPDVLQRVYDLRALSPWALACTQLAGLVLFGARCVTVQASVICTLVK